MRILCIFYLILSLSFSGCSNVFSAAADKATDEAYFEDAKKAADKGDYDTAITKFALLSEGYRSKTEVKEQWAGALAGKCGLSFIEFVNDLSNFSGGSATLFGFLMDAFKQKTVYPDYCRQAEAKIIEISSDPTVRTPSQNLFMLVLSMAKIGTYLRSRADIDGAGNLGNGSMDTAFNACTGDGSATSASTNVFSDPEIKQIVTGLGQVITNLAYVSASLIGGLDLTNLQSSCTSASAGLGTNPCNITDATLVDASTVTAMRYLLHTSASSPVIPIGIGGCSSPLVFTCCGL